MGRIITDWRTGREEVNIKGMAKWGNGGKSLKGVLKGDTLRYKIIRVENDDKEMPSFRLLSPYTQCKHCCPTLEL